MSVPGTWNSYYDWTCSGNLRTRYSNLQRQRKIYGFTGRIWQLELP